jgi:hypothetical protein
MNLRKQVGSALWLLVLLAAHVPKEWDGNSTVYVGGGNVISDAELAERLQVSPLTLAGWRRRLRKAQLIDWLLKPGIGRVYLITASKHGLAVDPPAESRPIQPSGAKALVANEAPKYLN